MTDLPPLAARGKKRDEHLQDPYRYDKTDRHRGEHRNFTPYEIGRKGGQTDGARTMNPLRLKKKATKTHLFFILPSGYFSLSI